MALLQRRLDPAVDEAQQEEAAAEIDSLLSGRVLSTLHRPAIAYRYRGISGSTIRDRFPDERCASAAAAAPSIAGPAVVVACRACPATCQGQTWGGRHHCGCIWGQPVCVHACMFVYKSKRRRNVSVNSKWSSTT